MPLSMSEYIVLDGIRKEVIRGLFGEDGFLETAEEGDLHLFMETTPQNLAPTINKIIREQGDIMFRVVGYSNGVVLIHVIIPGGDREEEEKEEEGEEWTELEEKKEEGDEGGEEEVVGT